MKLDIFKTFLISAITLHPAISFAQNDRMMKERMQQGFIVLSIPVKFDPINPIASLNAHTKLSMPLVYEPLITIGSQQELRPILAKSWKISTDNKSVTVTIKQHHHFSDGTEVTAKDVVDAIQRICSKESKVYEEIKGLSGCRSHATGKMAAPEVKVINKFTVKFNINCSPTNFLYQLASPSVVIVKKTGTGLIGSGPYSILSATANELSLSKNPYASKDNSSNNNGVAIFYAKYKDLPYILDNDKPDGSLMYRMQDIWNITNANYKLVKVNPNITETLVLNNQRFPFSNAIVRKALLTAIYNNFDKTCIPGSHKAYGIIPNGTGGSIENIAPKSLPVITPDDVFREVPSLKNKKIKVLIHQLKDLQNDCESRQIINAAKPFNIDIKFKYHKNYSTLEPLYLNHKLDGFIELYVFKNREAYSILQYFTKSGENNANVNHLTIDNMINNAIAVPSSHHRFQAYRKIAGYMQDEAIVIPLYYMDHGNILSKCIAGTSDNFLFNPFIHIPQLHKISGCNF